MILENISIYDEMNKLAMPTIQYVEEETGENLVIAQGTQAKANAFIKQMSRMAKNILHSERIGDVANEFDKLIKEEEAYRLEFINFVCSLIYDFYVLGIDDYFKVSDSKSYRDTLSVKSKAYLDSGLLGIKRFREYTYKQVI